MPIFQRSPRSFPSLPTAEVEIQAPPPVPGRPTSSLVAVLLPFAFTLVGLGLSVAFLTGSNYSFLLLSLPLMFGSALVGVINYFNERKKYNQTLEQRQRLYRDHLHERRQALEESAAQQRRALLASGSLDNTVRLWRVADGALLQTLEGHTDRVWSVAFSPDGALLASGSREGTVRLWGVK